MEQLCVSRRGRQARVQKDTLSNMEHPKSCEGCVYRDKRNPNMCRYCAFNEPTVFRFEPGKVDPFRLAEGLRRKQQGSVSKGPVPAIGNMKRHVELAMCSRCGQASLFRNSRTGEHECLNLKCGARDIFADVIWPHEESGSSQDS